MKKNIISGIAAAAVTFTAFASFGMTASAKAYNASDVYADFTNGTSKVLIAGTDTIKQDGGTTAYIYKSLLKLTYMAANGTTQLSYSETENGKSAALYKTSRYTYWRVTSAVKENHDYTRDDYVITLTANDPYVNASSTTNTWTGKQFPLVAVKGSAGTVQYSLDNETWSTAVPTASEVGTYTVYCRAVHGNNDNTNNVNSPVTTVNSIIVARGVAAGEKKASAVKKGDVFVGGIDSIYQDGGTSVIYHSLLKLSYAEADGTKMNGQYTEAEDGQSAKVYRSDNGRYLYWTVTEKSSNVIDYYGQFPRTDYSITLTARDPSLKKAPGSSMLQYTGEAQELVTAGEVENGKLLYSLDDGESWSEEIPTAVEPNFYVVLYKMIGDANYNNTDQRAVVSAILPKQEEETPDELTLTGEMTVDGNGVAHITARLSKGVSAELFAAQYNERGALAASSSVATDEETLEYSFEFDTNNGSDITLMLWDGVKPLCDAFRF